MKRTTTGQRNQYIELLHNVPVKNSLNEEQDDWQLLTPAWAKIRTKSVAEDDESGRLKATASYSITIDWIPNIDNTLMIAWEGRRLNIVNANDPDGTKQVLLIEAEYHGG